MADALLLSSQRAVPERALTLGFTFRYPSLRAALTAIAETIAVSEVEGAALSAPVIGHDGA